MKVTGIEIPTSGATFIELNCNNDVCSNNGNTQNIEGDDGQVEGSNTLPFQGRFVTGGSSEYSTANTVCTTETVCNDLECTGNPGFAENKICMTAMDDFGNALYVRDNDNGDLMQCRGEDGPSLNINEGDPWCPKGFIYKNNTFVNNKFDCHRITQSCDSGFSGQLEKGCDDLVGEQTDLIWSQYTDGCFKQEHASVPFNNYDQGCCLLTTIAGFNVYQYEGVKIY